MRVMVKRDNIPKRLWRVARGNKRRVASGAIILFAALALPAHYLWKYPFGRSPQAAAALYAALCAYAEAHDGRFPTGGETPEASLTALYREAFLTDLTVLRGKCVPVEQVRRQLDRGLPLDPATCGWHYEEGLGPGDDPALALAWDKFGLGPDGGRVFRGGCEVLFVDGTRRVIRDYLWTQFTKQQTALRNERDRQRWRQPVAAEE